MERRGNEAYDFQFLLVKNLFFFDIFSKYDYRKEGTVMVLHKRTYLYRLSPRPDTFELSTPLEPFVSSQLSL